MAKHVNPRSTSNGDKALGLKIRTRRMLAGMSQSDLGAHLNVSFQQIQKYEKGTNRVSVVRLRQIADALGENMTYFMDATAKGAATSQVATELAEAMADKYSIRLVRAYTKLPEDIQHKLVVLTENMVEAMPS